MAGKQSTQPWKSRLIPYQKEIMDAWFRKRDTLKMIQTELANKQVSISLSALSHFIRCRKNNINPHAEVKGKKLKRKKTPVISPEALLEELVNRSPEDIVSAIN